jgi:hypothetical protein
VFVDLLKMRHHCTTELGQVNSRWRADKELASKFSFKPSKASAQRRLRDVASFSGAGEAKLLACCEKIFHLLYFHGASRWWLLLTRTVLAGNKIAGPTGANSVTRSVCLHAFGIWPRQQLS